MNQNTIQEEIKIGLKTGNACYHSLQHLLFSSLLFKNIKMEMYRNLILSVGLYGCAAILRFQAGTSEAESTVANPFTKKPATLVFHLPFRLLITEFIRIDVTICTLS